MSANNLQNLQRYDHPNWDLAWIVADLRSARQEAQSKREFGSHGMPSREVLRQIIKALRGVLYPMYRGTAEPCLEGEDFYVGHTLDATLNLLFSQVLLELRNVGHQSQQEITAIESLAVGIVRGFSGVIPAIRRLLDTDVEAAYRGDPAARSIEEVLICYPGVLAMIHHRLAHQLYRAGVPLLARIIAELAHSETGIDIHPGAQIGPGFFIDHGTGVVIGETAIIGCNVRLYQAVTLGAKRFEKDDNGDLCKGQARHPIVEDDVVIYAGATVLGRVTIGRGSTIGGSVWLTRSVPPHSHVTQARSQNGNEGTDEDRMASAKRNRASAERQCQL